ncbi:MAG: SurA N-terminal domain-containing protein [Candidatus Omnitrophica bacterium]|nr:SurA N-terminal domain-containing protein [Candidatus Omnitrophota bacterium]
MLKKLRNKKTAKKIWIVLAILIVPAFVLWGFGGAIRDKDKARISGKIFGKTISPLDYNDALEATKNQAIMQFGDNLAQIQKQLNLESQAWERLMLLAEAKKHKIKVTDKEVVTLIESYPFFKNKNGQFDNRIYSETLHYVFRTQPRVFEEQTRQNLMLQKLYQEVTANVKIDEAEVKDNYIKANAQVSIHYIAGIPSDFTKNITVPETELKEYFSKNSFKFKQPISFNIEYTILDSEEKTKNIISRLNKKEDFKKVAKELNTTLKETGLFAQTDPVPGIGWSPQLAAMLSKAKANEVLPALQMDKNYYVLKIKEKKDTYIPEFASIKEKVKDALIKDKSTGIAKEKIEACLKKLKERRKKDRRSADFSKAAKEYGLKSSSTELFKYGTYIEGIGASDNLWTAARKLKENEFSEIISIPAGFYIIRLKSKTEPDDKKFETEKKDFTQNLLQQKKQESFIKFASELEKKALSK